jgi:Putative Ig domain
MTPREKVLSIGVGVALTVAVGSYAWSTIQKGFAVKQARVDQLRSDIMKRDTAITDGLMDRNKLTAITPMSLPSNSEQAVADYNEWIIDWLAKAKLASPKQTYIGETPEYNVDTQKKRVYSRFKFQVSGRGTIENLTNLLYDYYQKNYLHRISQLKIALVPREAYQLDFTLVTEVLALDVASKTQPVPTGTSHRVKKSLAEYSDEIVGRNLFSPANHPPRWSETATTEAVRGSPLNYDPGAKDADAGQKVSYEIVGDAPEGLRIGKDSSGVSWMPEKVGKYTITLKATDNGLPRQSSEQKLTINVVDPPPVVEPTKEVKMDVASQAEISFLGSGREGPEAWVRSKLEGKTTYLKIGDKLTLGSVGGTVVAIGANYMELETDGKKWTVGLDENLADAYRRIKVD